MKLEIVRMDADERGILGILNLGSGKNFYTLELPYLDNATNISSIPVGDYVAINHISPKFGRCIKVLNVEGRSNILIHAGNTVADTKGCILVGAGLEDNPSAKIITSSVKALNSLLKEVEGVQKLELVIKNATV